MTLLSDIGTFARQARRIQEGARPNPDFAKLTGYHIPRASPNGPAAHQLRRLFAATQSSTLSELRHADPALEISELCNVIIRRLLAENPI